MTKALKKFDNKTTIMMSAQLYLVKFYEEFNFYKKGEEYLEDNIPHVKMVKMDNLSHNGLIISKKDFYFSLFNRGIKYGDSFFDTVRCSNGFPNF